MKDLLKTIIKDFHSKSLPNFINRDLSIPINSGKTISIVGSRRAGKTYFLFQLIAKLQLGSVKKTDIIYINFEDERLNLKTEDLHLIMDAYYELYPDNDNELYLFFDEIQNINNWEKFIRRLYDTVTKNIFITGSSSKLLSKEIATSLRGRSVSYEIFPLTFKEYLNFFNIDSTDFHSTRNKSKIVKMFNSYLTTGGFPEVVHYDDEFRAKTLQSYLDVMIFRDIIERYDISNPIALKYIIKKSISNVSNYLSINKLYNELKSTGIKVSKDSIYLFLNYIQDCYLLFLVNIYSESINVQNTNDKKIYCIDNGLANNVSFSFSENTGRLLENDVYLN
ncbi:MAG: ATP-binding protein, partial [Ignavibacteriota bacterium]